MDVCTLCHWLCIQNLFQIPNYRNDPNGPFYDAKSGIYHLMFQYKTPRTWGHAISTDLLHWQNLPIAINNDETYDKGILSIYIYEAVIH